MTLLALATQQDADRLFLFEETSGNSVDSMGGTAITWSGNPTYNQTGPNAGQKAIQLDGTGDYGNMGTALPANANGFTVSVHFKTADSTNRMDLLGSNGTRDFYLSLNRNDTATPAAGRMRFILTNVGNQQHYVAADTGFYDNEWHHLVVWYSLDAAVVAMLDGTFYSTTQIAGSAVTAFSALDQDLYLGDTNNGGTPLGNEFAGSIANLCIIPWRISEDAARELGAASPAAITAIPTLAAPHVQRQINISATRFAVDVTGDRRMAASTAFNDTDAGDVVTFKHGATSNNKTLSVSNMSNRDGGVAENGVVAAVASGTQTIAAEASTGTPSLQGFCVRPPDSISTTVIEAGSATHCSPQIWTRSGVTTYVGAELFSGDRWAWQSGAAQKIFDPISGDEEERYHNGVAVLGTSTGLVFLQIGHTQPYLRLKTCTGNDLSTLSGETQLGSAATQLTYCMAAVNDSGEIACLVRDQQGVDGIALVRISDPHGTPTATFDYIVSGNVYYPRGLVALGDDWVALFQLRPFGSGWQDWYAARYLSGSGEWTSLDNVTTSATGGVGTLGTPRFGTPANISIRADQASAQAYLGEGFAAQDAGSSQTNLAAIFADTVTDDPDTSANTTMKLAGYAGATGTLTETSLGLATANSYRQSGVCIADGNDVYALVTDRGSYVPTRTDPPDDESAFYYNYWGGTPKAFRIADPYSASPAFTALSAPSITGDVAGWMAPVGGTSTPTISYQEQHEALSMTTKQGTLELFALSSGSHLAPTVAVNLNVPLAQDLTNLHPALLR